MSWNNSTPPLIPPTINAAVIQTSVLQNYSTITAGLGVAVGSATLVGGTVKVDNNYVSPGDFIYVTLDTPGGTLGDMYSVPSAFIGLIDIATGNRSFVINSLTTGGSPSASDTSTLRYLVVKPA